MVSKKARRKEKTRDRTHRAERRRAHNDQLFKLLFRCCFPDLMQIVAPDVAALLALERRVAIPTERFSRLLGGAQHLVDLLFQVPLLSGPPDDGGDGLIAVHVENEGRWGADMPERMWDYFIPIWNELRCPVIPIVVYLTGGPAGVADEEFRLRVGPRNVVTFSYYAFGLSGSDAETFLARDEPLAAGLAAWMSSDLSPAEHSRRCHLRVAKSKPGLDARELLFNCIRTGLQLGRTDRQEFVDAMTTEIQQANDERVRRILEEGLTWADKCAAEGEQKGRAEGLAEGRAEGRAEGLEVARKEIRRLVLGLLADRFGRLPSDVRKRVQAISSTAKLSRLARRVSTAKSLAELGLAADGRERG